MEKYMHIIRYYLAQKATIHIYSFPSFTLETFLAILIMAINFLLYLDVTGLIKKSFARASIDCDQNFSADASTISRSSCETTYQRCKEFYSRNFGSVLSPFCLKHINYPKSKPSNDFLGEKRRYANRLMSINPEQYAKLEKQRMTNSRNKDCTSSLTTLCKNVISQKYSSATLKKQLELAKEHLECKNMSVVGKYVGQKTSLLTNSLFDMLENLITKTSLANPLPFKGDITTLALDVAELSNQNSSSNYKNVNS